MLGEVQGSLFSSSSFLVLIVCTIWLCVPEFGRMFLRFWTTTSLRPSSPHLLMSLVPGSKMCKCTK